MVQTPDERSTEPATEPEAQGQTDLLTIGMLAFFVALIGIVGALLLVPTLF